MITISIILYLMKHKKLELSLNRLVPRGEEEKGRRRQRKKQLKICFSLFNEMENCGLQPLPCTSFLIFFSAPQFCRLGGGDKSYKRMGALPLWRRSSWQHFLWSSTRSSPATDKHISRVTALSANNCYYYSSWVRTRSRSSRSFGMKVCNSWVTDWNASLLSSIPRISFCDLAS